LFFGAVQLKKSYVSFHLMPVPDQQDASAARVVLRGRGEA
jgi:hypothetical protein